MPPRSAKRDANPHLAEDLAQSVFVELARKAKTLQQHPALAGWLYTCVRLTAANARRAEDRRQRGNRNTKPWPNCTLQNHSDFTWRQIRPVLDDALHELAETDRAALVLRFFENLSLREVGTQLGVNENAARMRVDRALDKLQELLSRRGITSTSSALAAALVAGAVVSAPAGLAATITTTAMAPALSRPGEWRWRPFDSFRNLYEMLSDHNRYCLRSPRWLPYLACQYRRNASDPRTALPGPDHRRHRAVWLGLLLAGPLLAFAVIAPQALGATDSPRVPVGAKIRPRSRGRWRVTQRFSRLEMTRSMRRSGTSQVTATSA